MIASLVATAAIAIGVLLFGEFDETTARILSTTALISAASLVSMPAGILLDRGRAPLLAWTTIALTIGAALLALFLIWRDWDDTGGEPYWKALAIWATFAVAASQTCATTSRRRDGDTQAVYALYVGAIGLAALFALMVLVAALEEIDDAGFYRALGAVAVADVLFVILQSVVRRAAGVPRESAAATATIRVTGPPDVVALAADDLERRGLRVERG